MTGRLIQVTEEKVTNEKGSFREGKGCVGQVIAVKMLVEEYLGKDEKLNTILMDLEKAYDRVDRKVLWYVLNIYDVGGQLMEQIKAFYRVVRTCMKVNVGFSGGFALGAGVR